MSLAGDGGDCQTVVSQMASVLSTQGSWLGPFSFIVLIDDLKPSCPAHKYVDDTTLTEILSRNQSSFMDANMNELRQWSVANNMLINEHKTKEMIVTLSHTLTIQNLLDIERVDTFKLLGIYVSTDLSWNSHVTYINKRANSRLHFCDSWKGQRYLAETC